MSTGSFGPLLISSSVNRVFPGIELTLAVPCQAILILDADFEDNRFGAVLTALAINPAPDGDSKTAETTRLENIHSLRTLKEKLDEHVWLRERYIVCAAQPSKRCIKAAKLPRQALVKGVCSPYGDCRP
jgi:chromosome segregation protein